MLLRQDSYRALTEEVRFTTADGGSVAGTHTARFGEVKQRGYACSPEGRRTYDECLAAAEAMRGEVKEACDPFAALGRSAAELFARGQILGRYRPTGAGLAARAAGARLPAALETLLAAGLATRDPLRYEDFLPVSAAGIFASNLRQQAAGHRPQATGDGPVVPRAREELEGILGRPIIDPLAADVETEAASIRDTLAALGEKGHLRGGGTD